MKHTQRVIPAAIALLLVLLPAYGARAQSFADPAFQATWERTDKPVAEGAVSRSFYWGPAPGFTTAEEYAEGVGGKRLVQYFDKSRMEINNPNASPTDPFYVTNGLLTVELITGKMQVGNIKLIDRWPAHIPLASDTDNSTAPTYATFSRLLDNVEDRTGTAQVKYIDKEGSVTVVTNTLPTREQTIAYYEPATGHNIPQVFWDFLNASGPTWQGGKLVTARLNDPWFYAAGLPISEPYWARVKIAGDTNTDVYIQAYQRRVLTYVPSLPEGFRVQMGNIGQHYYDWRYRDSGLPGGAPQPTPGTASGQVSITGDVKTPLTLDLDALAARPSHNLQVKFTEPDDAHTYRGPLLFDLLHEAGGEGDAGRDLLTRLIVVTGAGGKKAVLSWGEIDPIFAGREVILAHSQDVRATSAALPRLVIPSDKSGARSLQTVSNIEVRKVPTATTAGTALKITGLVNRELSMTAADLASRNPVEITVTYQAGGTVNSYRYKGVPLWQILNEAGVKPAGPNGNLSRYVQATGNTDDRNAIVSWGELDPAFSGVGVLVAYEQDGVPLGGGLTRLVVPSDARGGRYVPYLTRLELKEAAP